MREDLLYATPAGGQRCDRWLLAVSEADFARRNRAVEGFQDRPRRFRRDALPRRNG